MLVKLTTAPVFALQCIFEILSTKKLSTVKLGYNKQIVINRICSLKTGIVITGLIYEVK